MTAAAVHVWRADLDRAPDWRLLSTEERRRAGLMRVPGAGERWAAARAALRRVLARYLRRDPAAVEIAVDERGKPWAPGAPLGLRFNLSHSGSLALIAVASGREVGVDVELVERERDFLRLADLGLGPAAARAVRAAPAAERATAFYAAWVEREAVAKCHGVGLAAPLPPRPVSVVALRPGDRHAAAVALAGPTMPQIQRFSLPPA